MMPIFTLERVEGRIFRPVALTYAFALAGALFFTMTGVPALTAVLLKHRKVEEKSRGSCVWLRARYLTALRVALRYPSVRRWRRWGCWLARVAGPAAGRRVPARDERGRHPHHGHDAQRRLAGARRRGAARDAPRAALLPGGEGRPDRAGPPGGRHRRRGAQPGRDVRDHEAREASGRPGAARSRSSTRCAPSSSGGPASTTTSASRSRIAWRSRSRGIRGQVVVKIYGEDLDLMHEKLERGRSRSSRDARLARRRDLPGGQRAAHRRRHRSRGDRALRRPRCATSRTLVESAYGGTAGDRMWEGERRSACASSCRSPSEGDAASVGRLDDPGARTSGAARAAARRAGDACTSIAGRTQINREQGGRFLAIKCNIEGRDMATVRRRRAPGASSAGCDRSPPASRA